MGRREVFDPARAFAANREFAWGGQRVLVGAPFLDKSNPRRLRQLYDNRYLRMLPSDGSEIEEQEIDDGRPLFSMMTEQEIRDWMREHNVIPHPKSPKESLVRKARLLWEEMKAGILRPALPPGLTEMPAPMEVLHGIDASGGQQSPEEGDRQGVQKPTGQGDPPKRVRLNG